MEIPSLAGSPTLSVSNVSALHPLSSVGGLAMYRSISEVSSASNYSVQSDEDVGGLPVSRTSSASSTSAEPGTPGAWDHNNQILTDELQDMFERVLASGASQSTDGPTASSATIPGNAPSSGSGSDSMSVLTNTGAKTMCSFIPRPIVSQVSPPMPPSRSPSASPPATTEADLASPEFSFGSFMSGDDSSVGIDKSLLEEMFNFEEFVFPGDDGEGPLSARGFASDSEDTPDEVEPDLPATASNTPALAASGYDTIMASPSPVILNASTSTTSTLGENSKSLMEEVLSFVASTSGDLRASGSTRCISEVLQHQSQGEMGLGSLASSGSMGDVVMTSPVLVL